MKLSTIYIIILVTATIIYAGLKTIITPHKIRRGDAISTPIRSHHHHPLRKELVSFQKNKIDTGSTFQEELGFQPVTQDGLYVYSAFLGPVEGKMNKSSKIIIIGMDMTKAKRNLSCEFYGEFPPMNMKRTNFLKTGLSTAALKQNSPDNYNTLPKYCPIFIKCDLPKKMKQPKFVVVKNDRKSSQNITILKIHYPPKEPIFNVTACVKALYTKENSPEINPLPLIEWLEFNKMMGVEHFTFYNLSASPGISKVVQSYEEITFLPWNNPITSIEDIHDRGQFIQANDCAHRYRGVARFVIAVDFDEFLIIPTPHNFSDYFTFFKSILNLDEVKKRQPINQLLFEAVFSFSNWPKRINTNLTATYYNATFLRLPTMTTFVNSSQTKFVMLPENIVESGIHFAQQGVNGSTQYLVSKTMGQYLHFRECSEFFKTINPTLHGEATCLHANNSYVDNDIADKFGGEIVKRVDNKVTSLLMDEHQPGMWECLEI